MQRMQEANQAYSISPNFKLDRNWRIAILPPQDGDTELPDLYDRAGLLLMKPGCFTLIDRAEVERPCKSSGPTACISWTRIRCAGLAS
jgi:hypothetical protein